MNKTFWSFLDDIVKAAEELNVECSLLNNIAYCEGKGKDVKRFEALLKKFHLMTIRGEENRITYQGDDSNRKRNWEDRNFEIPLDFTKEDVDVALYKVRKKELQFLYKDDVLKVRGNKFELSMFSEWFQEFTKNRKKQKQDFKEFLENLRFEIITEKIQNPSCDDFQKQDILKKSLRLKVECIFGEDNSRVLEISGRADKVRCFKSYLQTISPVFPKYLYPKYWDFAITDDYAEIKVEPTSEEFEEIRSKVCGSLECAVLTKLIRVQNQGLMNNYLTTICSEKKTEEERKLLFYGTEIQDPEEIYKYSQTGFDLSYASSRGKFAKGFPFPITALYAHGYAYRPNPKTFQVILADVLVGNAFISITGGFQNSENGIPEGFDSMLDPNNVYVIYKNSQSYPLYLVEYTLQLSAANYMKEQETGDLLEEEKEGDFLVEEEEETKEQWENLPKRPREIYNDRPFDGPSFMCLQRVSKELEALRNDKFINENFLVDSMESKKYNEWIIPLIGPPETPYDGGLFQISITFPHIYPVVAPRVKFKTKIYHPCILGNGMINLELLENWAPTHRITEVLTLIYCLLGDPASEEPFGELRDQFQKDRLAFEERARAWTRLYAM